MKTAIMTDTNSGISLKEADSLGIFCLPMPVVIDGKDYFEDKDLTVEEYLKALTGKRNVTTSQPSPLSVTEEWERILSSGYDEIVYIPMSSGLSSSCSAAMGYAEDYEGKVFVVDNKRISISQRTSVLDAKALADQGKGAEEIKRLLEKHATDYIIYLGVDTLEYFAKTGRASQAALSIVSNVLSVKPVLKTTGDKFEPVTVARSQKKCEEKMLENLKLNLTTRFKGVDKKDLLVAAATSCVDKKDADKWYETVCSAAPGYETFYVPLSCSITTHTGPNAKGVGIMKRIRG